MEGHPLDFCPLQRQAKGCLGIVLEPPVRIHKVLPRASLHVVANKQQLIIAPFRGHFPEEVLPFGRQEDPPRHGVPALPVRPEGPGLQIQIPDLGVNKFTIARSGVECPADELPELRRAGIHQAHLFLQIQKPHPLARRRRHISQASLAERMGASLSTVRRMEGGDVRVPIHFFARALHIFGEIKALEQLLDTPNDEIGLTLMDERLPKRVRSKAGGAPGAL